MQQGREIKNITSESCVEGLAAITYSGQKGTLEDVGAALPCFPENKT